MKLIVALDESAVFGIAASGSVVEGHGQVEGLGVT
jgi:hypothetical protein